MPQAQTGENNPACKLTDEQTTAIRVGWASGRTQTEMSHEFGISISQVCRIVNGKQRGDALLLDTALPEQSLPVVGWDGYAVSRTGDVFSCRTNGGLHPGRWRKLKATPNEDGYPQVSIWDHQKSKTVRVHTLVLTAFIGPCPDGMECCHEDGNRANNCLENLRWGTDQSNIDDRERHGNTARGERNGRAKISPEDVLEIKKLRGQGMPFRKIARKFGLVHRQIIRIVNEEAWAATVAAACKWQ